MEHDPSAHVPGHPDTPERLVALERELHGRDRLGFERREVPAASEAELEPVHTPRLIASIKQLSSRAGGAIDTDTYVSAPSYRAAPLAASAVAALVAMKA